MLTEMGLLDEKSASNLSAGSPREHMSMTGFLFSSYHNLVILPSLNLSDIVAGH